MRLQAVVEAEFYTQRKALDEEAQARCARGGGGARTGGSPRGSEPGLSDASPAQ